MAGQERWLQGTAGGRAREVPAGSTMLLAMNEHYGKVQGNVLAGAVTYFGFLSFFPILAIAFAVVGYVSARFPDARENLVTAIEQLFPGIVSDTGESGHDQPAADRGQRGDRRDHRFRRRCCTAGLGWVSGLRLALETTFERAARREAQLRGRQGDRPRCAGRDRRVPGRVGRYRRASSAARPSDILDAGRPGRHGARRAAALGRSVSLLGLAASTVLFYVIYQILGHPDAAEDGTVAGCAARRRRLRAAQVPGRQRDRRVGGSAFAPLAIAVTLGGLDQLLLQAGRLRRVLGDDLAAASARSPASSRRVRGCRRTTPTQPAPAASPVAEPAAVRADASTPAVPSSAPSPASSPPSSSAAPPNAEPALAGGSNRTVPDGVASGCGRVVRMTHELPTRPDIEAAAFRNGSRIRRTPVLTLAADDSGLAGNVVLKLEFLQHTGSFKARGALNSVLSVAGRYDGRLCRVGRQPRGRGGVGGAARRPDRRCLRAEPTRRRPRSPGSSSTAPGCISSTAS